MTQLFNNWISNPTSHLVNYLILLLVIGNVISATVICADDDSTDCDRSFSAYDLRTLFPESPRRLQNKRGFSFFSNSNRRSSAGCRWKLCSLKTGYSIRRV
ncbi:hypothetical protein M3Y96_00943100 [Aphelenchoides besseyi]|nr:hypothetical protein M3Y96_00943100 [Aphelenchoides besseyi]